MHRNDLDKPCFAHYSIYSDSKDLAKRTILDKILKELMKLPEILTIRNNKAD